MINGKRYAWENVTITLPQGELVDVESIDYDDSRKVNKVYGRGSRPVGWSQGNYEAKGKLTMRREEFQKLLEHAGSDGIYGMEPFEITVSYAEKDSDTVTDTLQSCVFNSRKTGAKQNDESINVDLEFDILDEIQFDGKTAFQDSAGSSQSS